MRKGLVTQSAAVLLSRSVALGAVARACHLFEIVARKDAAPGHWMGAAALILAMRPDVNGYVMVDVLDRPWPDEMGSAADEGRDVFAAWNVGRFGPFVYPGALSRAVAMSGWDGTRDVAGRHQAFVRIVSTYALGGGPDDPVMPADYESLPELELVTDIARAVLDLPGALAYFNPNGEVLCSASSLDELLPWYRERGAPAVGVWANARRFTFDDAWSVVDTVGMEQLDVFDHEACFPTADYDPSDVENFVRNVVAHALTHGPVFRDGDTADGPGGVRWQVRSVEESVAPAPRPVLRWVPVDGSRPPPSLADST